ncbi:fibronectin type III domain-containing protein [Paeniglutamicibacter antarcticus]|uniref:Fibronectin type III domain-containing protein n=1 Tax=Arthrobacter terrae TaxID=2935737 RepID=A0A931G3P1_9MICC|nr:fibronectin type III domain-containing protein [Arthrobacter terrae]MBG0738881.1 fibronectin type III domain-containing protein [Arthrobacter terrae]
MNPHPIPPSIRLSSLPRVVSTFRSESGAFDLPSILTGVVVVGVLTAGVLTSVFGVIPFAQDKGAMQDLAAVRTAEGVAKAKDSAFVTSSSLVWSSYLPASDKIAAETDAGGSCYTAVALSGSGRLFYAESTSPSARELTNSEMPACVSDTVLRSLIDRAGGDSSSRPQVVPAAPVLAAQLGSDNWSHVSWTEADRATSYRVESNDGRGWTTVADTTNLRNSPAFLFEGDTFKYRVYARNPSGESPASNTVTVHRTGSINVFANSTFDQGEEGWTITGPHTIAPEAWLGGFGNVVSAQRGSTVTISQSVAASVGESMHASVMVESQTDDTHLYMRFLDSSGAEITGGTQDTFIAKGSMHAINTPEVTAPAGTARVTVTMVTGVNTAMTDNFQLFIWR